MTPATVAQLVLGLVRAPLIAAGRDVSTAFTAVGGIAWDDCCGTLVVAPERTFRTIEPFPTEAVDDSVCTGNPIGVDLVVLLLRCVPVLDNMGQPPPVADMQEAYDDVLDDAALIWNALAGPGLPALGDPDDNGVEPWLRASLVQTYVGAEGGCIGVETRVTVGIDWWEWCADTEVEP